MKEYLIKYQLNLTDYTLTCSQNEVISLGKKLKELGAKYVYVFELKYDLELTRQI